MPNLLKQCGDIEVNPCPNITIAKIVNIGHVNIWSLLAPIKIEVPTLKQNLTKFNFIKNHILQHDYDIFGISETWLDHNDSDDDILLMDIQSQLEEIITTIKEEFLYTYLILP